MRKWVAIAILMLGSGLAWSQETIVYTLSYTAPGDNNVRVRIDLPQAHPAPLAFVMPRGYPGGYDIVLYDSFVEEARAYSAAGEPVPITRAADGPRWLIGTAGQSVQRIEYSVAVVRMEKELLSAVETSKVRPLYAGLLGYSVFGYIDGLQTKRTRLQVSGPRNWPVFTTLSPHTPPPGGTVTAAAANFDELADSQILMGPELQLRSFPGKINLVLASYSEGKQDLALEGGQARTALDRVQQYFGDLPFATYTVHIELLKPLSGHDYDFSQEHLNSGSFSFSTLRGLTDHSTEQELRRSLFNFAHHMAHSWIPKRAYSDGYSPFSWEIPPVGDTIWFNEGFGQFAAAEALSAGMSLEEGMDFWRRYLDRMNGILNDAPDSIRRMPLPLLSREASYLYSVDFRVGMNTFARGALMAADIDARIKKESQGKNSLRSGLQALLVHTQQNHQPFRVEELAFILQQATGVDVHDIVDRWLKPLAP